MTSVAVTASPAASGNVYAIFGQTVPAERLAEAAQHPDALKIAYDVGVLELLSLSLTIFTVLLGVSAVFGFWMIRGAAIKAAERAAREEAKEQAEKVAERIARKYLEERAPELVAQILQARGGITPPEIALTPEEVQGVIADAKEIGPSKDGSN